MNETFERVEVWRWSVEPPGPHLAGAVAVMEALRGAVSETRRAAGYGPFPESFHGGGGSGHAHAFWLPEDNDGDGMIDHIVVFCANGVDALTIAAMAAVQSFRLGGRRYRIAPSWMGPRPSGGLFGPAAVWRAVTPYVTPRWRLTKTGRERADSTPEAQLTREIALRGLPEPLSIDWRPSVWCGEDCLLATQFVTGRSKRDESPPGDAMASFPHVTFPEAVAGPLAFGYAAHFGLGMLTPVIIDGSQVPA